MYLLDTVVVSERTKAIPDPKVRSWINSLHPDAQFISTLTLGEIEFGIARLAPGAQRERLETWRGALVALFAGRILAVDRAVTEHWGRQRATMKRTIPHIDALIGATAHVHGLVLATRNERDFVDFGVRVVNPWRA